MHQSTETAPVSSKIPTIVFTIITVLKVFVALFLMVYLNTISDQELRRNRPLNTVSGKTVVGSL